jgi:hypothetical protein
MQNEGLSEENSHVFDGEIPSCEVVGFGPHTRYLLSKAQINGLLDRARKDENRKASAALRPSTPIPRGLQHIDAPVSEQDGEGREIGWSNPPHRSHLCQGCGHIWRPADVPTEGVAAIKTHGQHDSPSAPVPAEGVKEALGRLETLFAPSSTAGPELRLVYMTTVERRRFLDDLRTVLALKTEKAP